MDTEQPAPRTRLRSMLLVTGVSLGAALLITGAYEISHERIVENRAYSYKKVGDGWKRSVLSYANAGATS